MKEPIQYSTQTALSFCLFIVVVFLTLFLKLEAQKNIEERPQTSALESFASVP